MPDIGRRSVFVAGLTAVIKKLAAGMHDRFNGQWLMRNFAFGMRLMQSSQKMSTLRTQCLRAFVSRIDQDICFIEYAITTVTYGNSSTNSSAYMRKFHP